jgi:hypothetical protein
MKESGIRAENATDPRLLFLDFLYSHLNKFPLKLQDEASENQISQVE